MLMIFRMACQNIYRYDPSIPLNVIGVVAWGLLSTILLIQTLKTKKHFFLVVPIAGYGMNGSVRRVVDGIS